MVLLIAAISFTLSYHALRDIAQSHGFDGWLSYLWPLLIDFALVVFSLCVVTAHLHSESTWRQWALVALATITTITYNYLHAPANLIAQSVAIVPPVMLFFSFELLMSQLKASVARSTHVQRLTHEVQQVTHEAQQLQQWIDDPITTRRQQVAGMVSAGNSQRAIAGELGISVSTVRSDIKALNGVGK
jgi:DNA-binding CsgD family transcriptional regulator